MRTFIRLFLIAIVAVVASLGGQALASGRGGGTGGDGTAAPSLPTGVLVPLKVAGPLAVTPNGRLYVADVDADRILVRLPDGTFRVVAGDGTGGYAGDGGPAIDAELTKVTDMAFAPNGSLYIADGQRVRVIAPNGIIRTVAGSGQITINTAVVANGTPALSAALPAADGLSIALSPGGVLYISTGNQILYLEHGQLDVVHDVITCGFFQGKQLNGFGQIGIDSHGDIDFSGFNGWAIWQIAPNGVATQASAVSAEARRSGGKTSLLERAPDGSVYGESGSTLVRIEGDTLVRGFTFNTHFNGEWFNLTYFAFAPSGTVYADEIPGGGGFERHQQLISESGGHVSLLWQEDNAITQ